MMDTIRPLPVISTVQVVNKLFEGGIMQLTKIFEPITINKTEFKNRMVDFVTVGRRKEMIFIFRDGTEIEV